jgi:predicted ArsR family transcriptional regulator
MKVWTFITNHGAVLGCIATRSKIKAKDIAIELGLSERSIRRIITDLTAEGYIEKTRESGINRYKINHHMPLRRVENRDIKVQDLLNVFIRQAED